MGAVAQVLPASGKPTGGHWAQERCAKQKNAKKVESSRMCCKYLCLTNAPITAFCNALYKTGNQWNKNATGSEWAAK